MDTTTEMLDRKLDSFAGQLLENIDRDMSQRAWDTADDCLAYWYLTLYGPEEPVTADHLASAMPCMRELYRLYRFQQHGFVTHKEGELKDGLPVYYSRLGRDPQ